MVKTRTKEYAERSQYGRRKGQAGGPQYFYTTADDNVLIEGYKRYGNNIKQLATLLPDRSYWSVRTRIYNLRQHTTDSQVKKLFKQNMRNPRPNWTEKETDTLIRLCQNLRCYASKLVSYFHGKSVRDIHAKIVQLRKAQSDPKKNVPEHKNIGRVMNYWTAEEQSKLEEGYKLFGNDYVKIAKHVGTRDRMQVINRVMTCKRFNIGQLPKVVSMNKYRKWTSDELKTYVEVVEQYGVNIQNRQNMIVVE